MAKLNFISNMVNVELNKQAKLSPHFTLGELCKTSVNSLDGNIPSHEAIENLKRLCPWLEDLRARYNRRYVLEEGGVRREEGEYSKCGNGGGSSGASSDHPAHTGTPPNSGGEKDAEEPIVITSGYRSPEVNRCVGGVNSSNHLTGCAVDIRCVGVEQAIRYAAILLDIADEWKLDFDELLIERNKHGRYWVHFAVRPPKEENRRKVMIIRG